jgi:hypothetical protein
MMESFAAGRGARAGSRHLPSTLALGALCAAVALVCGCGPVGSGGTGAPAGVAAAGFSQGPINGFGSILVNGSEYDDTQAQVVDDDGNVLSASADLHLGSSVDVRSAASGGVAVATQIHVHDDLVGPVTAPFDAASGRLEVLGEAVLVDETTFVDGVAGGIEGLANGNVVEVAALYDAQADTYHATRIALRSGASSYVVRGAVAGFDGASLHVGSQVFDYGGLSLPVDFGVGQVLLMHVATTPAAGGHWKVTSVEDGVVLPPDGATGDLRGSVGAVVDDGHAYVGGVQVDASTAARAPAGSKLVPGALVVVYGTMNGPVLIASRVDFQVAASLAGGGTSSRYPMDFEISGPILGPVDAAAHTFALRGPTTIDYASATFTGGSASDLAQGRKVTVEGTLSQDGSRLVATSISFGS